MIETPSKDSEDEDTIETLLSGSEAEAELSALCSFICSLTLQTF